VAPALTPAYDALASRHARWHRLSHLQSLATWDRMTGMPAGAAGARAAAQGELASLLHAEQSDVTLDALLASACDERLDDDQQRNLAAMRRQRRIATAIPARLVERRNALTAGAMQAWGPAREANDWTAFAPPLRELVALVREEAAHLGDALDLSPYDALLETHEPGLRSQRLDALFAEISEALPRLIGRAIERQRGRPVIEPVGPFPVATQRALAEQVMRLLGFDFNRGRLDTSVHPFTGGVPEDVRLTTRYVDSDFLPALLATMHETGHACYQQNLPREWLGQPLAGPHSAALHEGQALCFERQLAPRAAFAALLSPWLEKAFGAQPAFEPINLQHLMTRVRPGRIRIQADELTYPAHIILRVEIERGLIDGTIPVDDLPAAWSDRMQRLLGIDTRGDFANGPLQDVHWPQGMFGYFPSYLLGAMVAAQCFEAIAVACPDLDTRIGGGDASAMSRWLGTHIWQRGARDDLDATLARATGQPLQARALLKHLEARYGQHD
jgi:carboxypeptidase Taq